MCDKNYAFKENDRSKCIGIENFEEYYTMDGGISYYPCDLKDSDCSRCYYKSDENITKCYLCKNELVLLSSGGQVKCLDRNLMKNNSIYITINQTHMGICNETIPNCLECENARKCKKCKDSYYFNNYENKCLVKDNEIINDNNNNVNNNTNSEKVIIVSNPNSEDESGDPENKENRISISFKSIIKNIMLFLLYIL